MKLIIPVFHIKIIKLNIINYTLISVLRIRINILFLFKEKNVHTYYIIVIHNLFDAQKIKIM